MSSEAKSRARTSATSSPPAASPRAAGAGSGERFNVGLLGFGTVGSAFFDLLHERAAEIERFNGVRPVISGVLTRSRGSFEEILAEADLRHRAGARVPAAGHARWKGRGQRQQAAALAARRGAVRHGSRT